MAPCRFLSDHIHNWIDPGFQLGESIDLGNNCQDSVDNRNLWGTLSNRVWFLLPPVYESIMKRRQARKIFKRVTGDFRTERKYKATTVAAAISKHLGVHCPPYEAFLMSGLLHLVECGMLDISKSVVNWHRQTNIELAS